SPKATPAYEFSQPDKYLTRRTEFVGPHEAGLSNSGRSNETSHRHCRLALDILKHPIQCFAFDRWRDFNIIASNILTVAIDSRGVRCLIRSSQKDFKELRRCRVVMLPVTEKLPQILL